MVQNSNYDLYSIVMTDLAHLSVPLILSLGPYLELNIIMALNLNLIIIAYLSNYSSIIIASIQ